MADKVVNYNDISKVKDMKTLNLVKESFDRDYEKQLNTVKTLEAAHDASHKNFGFIKEAMESLSHELFRTKEGRSILNRYISCVKESATLGKMHQLYECVRRADKNIDVDRYLNETISLIGHVNANTYINDTAKVGKILGEAYIFLGHDKVENIIHESGNEDLNESVEYIGTRAKNTKNLSDFMSHCQVIKEHILSHNTKTAKHTSSNNIETAINDFNAKYGNELDENTTALVKELLENTDKEGMFNKYKSACLSKLEEKQNVFKENGDNLSSERIGVILEKVSGKKYNIETVNNDIFNLIEITNSLD